MESFTLFILASLALIIAPGPDIIYVLTRGIADGKKSGVISALGIGGGILVHTLAAALGLAVLLRTSAYAFWAIKVAGGFYLLYLGFQMIKNKEALDISGTHQHTSLIKCLLQGFLSNVLNPKVALFFVAFLPQFVDPGSTHHSLYMVLLGLVFGVMTVIIFMVIGLFAGVIGKWLQEKHSIAGKIRVGSGLAIMLLGLRLIVPDRSARL